MTLTRTAVEPVGPVKRENQALRVSLNDALETMSREARVDHRGSPS